MESSDQASAGGLEIVWAPIYQPRWDAQPEAYVEQGIVAWGRSRRLARASDAERGLKSYIGVRHFDPGRWHVVGEPRAAFFLSLFLQGHTVALHTYTTCQEALAALYAFHAALLAQEQH